MRDTIAVCLVRAAEEFQRDSLKAIYQQAREHDLFVQVFNTFEELEFHNLNDQGEESIFERIDYDRLCGMIVFCEKIKDSELNLRLIKKGKENGIPVVSIDKEMEDCYSILFDYTNTFEKIVRHLVEEHQCRTFFVMGGLRNNDFSDARIQVVRDVASEYGIELADEDIGYGDFWEDPCRAVMQEFLASMRPLPDAFISVNDTMALTICDCLHNAGYHIPKDTIVTGFDGIEEERYFTPRLTTAQQDLQEGGKQAVELICRVMQKQDDVERRTVIPFAVRFSESCGCRAIQEGSASVQIHKMYNALTVYRYFSKNMYDMIDEMTGTKTLGGVLETLPKYLSYLDTYRHIYLCVEGTYLEVYDDISAQIMEQNPGLNDRREIEMVILGEWHADKGFSVPLLCYKRKEPFPSEKINEDTENLFFVPLHVQETVFGYLAVNFDPEENDYLQLRNFTTNLSHILDSVRSRQQMENFNCKLKLANDKLEELYVRDPLTGIYNRRGFYQDIAKYLGDHEHGWLMVVSIDLNGLKTINDNYGHGEGDFAIKTVGRTLYRIILERGICARFGGDEFAVAIFYDEYDRYADAEFRKQLTEQLELVNKTAGKEYRITCSVGTQTTPADRNVNIDEVLKEADDKMYQDKKHFYEMLGLSEHEIR
ncbi:MAG: GGDEF domain-containing protein [Lachnospiraceae bacterium]|nr:GGDEF domain-containing protein [Lachnospiraceae bacterium]